MKPSSNLHFRLIKSKLITICFINQEVLSKFRSDIVTSISLEIRLLRDVTKMIPARGAVLQATFIFRRSFFRPAGKYIEYSRDFLIMQQAYGLFNQHVGLSKSFREMEILFFRVSDFGAV